MGSCAEITSFTFNLQYVIRDLTPIANLVGLQPFRKEKTLTFHPKKLVPKFLKLLRLIKFVFSENEPYVVNIYCFSLLTSPPPPPPHMQRGPNPAVLSDVAQSLSWGSHIQVPGDHTVSAHVLHALLRGQGSSNNPLFTLPVTHIMYSFCLLNPLYAQM